MSDTPLLTLPYLAAAQAQKHVTHNEALSMLDGLVHLAVASRGLASPPGSPVDGLRHLVAAAPTGDWAGHAGDLALRMEGAWRFFTPREGWRLWVSDEDVLISFDGTTWNSIGGNGDVTGPASATDTAIARFDGATGKLIGGSGVTIDDNGTLTLVAPAAGFAGLAFTAGALKTTPAAGDVELDGDCFYMTTDAGNRGVVAVEHFIRADSSRSLSSTTAEQALFNSPSNGRLTLETGAYFFEALYSLSGMSSTSGNSAFDILGAGTATLSTVLYHAIGADGGINVAAAQGGSTSNAAQSPVSIVQAGIGTGQHTSIRGTFEVTAAGTIQPAITLVDAAAATLAAGSYFRCRRVGANSAVSVGQWD